MNSCSMRYDLRIAAERPRSPRTEHGIFFPPSSVVVLAGGL